MTQGCKRVHRDTTRTHVSTERGKKRPQTREENHKASHKTKCPMNINTRSHCASNEPLNTPM